MSNLPKLVLYRGDGEWSALYADGRLVQSGDHYLSDEKIYELAGVEVRHSEDFLRGGSHYEDVAPTVAAAEAYTSLREARDKRAADLEARAVALEAEAAALRRAPIRSPAAPAAGEVERG